MEHNSQCPTERGKVIPVDAKRSVASDTLAEANGPVSSAAAGTGSSEHSGPVEMLIGDARSCLVRTLPSAGAVACVAVGMGDHEAVV